VVHLATAAGVSLMMAARGEKGIRADPARPVLARVRIEMQRRGLSQVDVAGLIHWTQSKVSKVLNGETALMVNDLDALCVAVGLRLTEAVRDHGVEFCAEMSPTELRVLEELRRCPGAVDALLLLLRCGKKP
jgi:transcriptional regulator with XRE-family HTH domain